ncbi:hypothetical protein [Caldimonas thermodepolymerans]|uniref:Uncharacterized protein n=1 Tax=Caldimonas thermodepolymerans TaxID=215580 RepID=A0AA46HVF1_9BURK|nr:hypothetical protein [Caldimonas thermodepolymerans]TCP06600.1 hypothetical protein EV676_10683 [Caldimonas thermodepolymerans]UZG49342.1 hypothetical protein ONS87_06905 [Caldimonas thermodepolymerans]
MNDLIERLRYEADISDRPGQMDRLNALADEFAAALEAAREDAERWRALREMDGGEIYALLGDCDGIHPEQADAAIDRARGKGVQS